MLKYSSQNKMLEKGQRMISIIKGTKAEYERFCEGNPLGARIISQLNSYGTKYPFALFWEQRGEGGELLSVISKVDVSITVVGSEANTKELTAFINAIGFTNISAEPGVINSLSPDFEITFKAIMKYKNNNSIKSVKDAEIISKNIDLSKIYDIIINCNKIKSTQEQYEAWIADISHRIRHGYADAVCAEVNEKIVSCALAVASTHTDVLIGGVATLDEYRKMGLARSCIEELIKRNVDKNIFIFCKEDKISFYNKLGFENIGITAEGTK